MPRKLVFENYGSEHKQNTKVKLKYLLIMDLNKWWSGLRVVEKERIASKILAKNPELKGESAYPYCTDLWNSLEPKRQEWIYKHCMFKHGYLDKIEFDGDPYTD